jgi:hypothetical protein
MSDETAEFLPFHALNEFMRPDYRLTVVRSALTALPRLPASFRSPVDKLTRKIVHVPGFRDGTQAPVPLRIAPTADAFQKSPELVAAILSAWAESQTDLRAKVHTLLQSRNWELLPPEADRTKLPGFMTKWPKGEDFDILNTAFSEAHPGETATTDDVSLMIVWLSVRLPYAAHEDEPPAAE